MEMVECLLNELGIKYRHMLRVYSCTKSLQEALDGDDRASVRVALKERALEIDKLMECDKRMERLVRGQTVISSQVLMRYLRENPKESGLAEDMRFAELTPELERLHTVWAKCIEYDKKLSVRLVGKKSHYEA